MVTVLRVLTLLAIACLNVSCLPVDPDVWPQREVSAEYVECDAAAREPACPDLADGTPTRCIPARQLGGFDFCAPAVASCDPSSPVCGPGLSCYRTDLL